MRSALDEVHKFSDRQKYTRENPDIVYQKVKSKIASNFKSQAKAKKREQMKKAAEANNESPISGSLKFLFEQRLSSARKSSSPSPLKSSVSSKLAGSINNRISQIQAQIEA